MLPISIHLRNCAPLEYQGTKLLITKDNDLWLNTASAYFDVSPLDVKIGGCFIKAIKYTPDKSVHTPSEDDLILAFGRLGCDLKDDFDLFDLKHKIKPYHAQVILNGKDELFFLKGSRINLLAKNTFIGISIKGEGPSIPKAFSHDPLFEAKRTLLDPNLALTFCRLDKELHQAHYLKDLPISKISDLIFHNPAFVKQSIKQAQPVSYLSSNSISAIFYKTKQKVELYISLNQFLWPEGEKRVAPLLLVDKYIKLHCFQQISSRALAKKELAFRSHRELSQFFPRIEKFWHDKKGGVTSFITSWADHIPYSEFLAFSKQDYRVDIAELGGQIVSIEKKDKIALELLNRLSVFQRHALLKNITPQTLFLQYGQEEKGITFSLEQAEFIEPEKEYSLYANPENLSPELLRKIHPLFGDFSWSDSHIIGGFSKDEIIAHERFQIGMLLFELYLGHSPFILLQNRLAIFQKYPLRSMTIDEVLDDPFSRQKLESYMTAPTLFELKDIYKDAYRGFSSNLSGIPEDVIDEDGHEFEEKYQAFIANPASYVLLDIFVSEDKRARLNQIYDRSYDQMIHLFENEIKRNLLETIAANTRSILEQFPGINEIANGRIGAILPLLDLDPSARPSFEVIYQALKSRVE